jgi:hypothetical protein
VVGAYEIIDPCLRNGEVVSNMVESDAGLPAPLVREKLFARAWRSRRGIRRHIYWGMVVFVALGTIGAAAIAAKDEKSCTQQLVGCSTYVHAHQNMSRGTNFLVLLAFYGLIAAVTRGVWRWCRSRSPRKTTVGSGEVAA